MVTYSNDATQQGFNNMSATANTATSPDGTQNADTITPSAGTSDHYLITGGASVSSGVIFTASVFVKKKDSDYLYFGTGGAAAWGSVAYRFSTNTFFNVGGGVTSYNATDMGNGWIRLTNTGTTGGTDLRILLTPSDSSGARTFNANGTDGLYIWGLQIEQSSYVTSAIETTSSSATRVADACYKTGISSLFGTNQGTFFIDLVYYGSKQFCYLFDVTDSANANRFLMYDSNGSGLFVFYNSTYGIISTIQLTKGQRYKIAVKYNSSGTIWYVNGVLSATEAISFAYQMSQIYLGIRYSISDNSNIQVNETIVFPTALTSTELASLTTI